MIFGLSLLDVSEVQRSSQINWQILYFSPFLKTHMPRLCIMKQYPTTEFCNVSNNFVCTKSGGIIRKRKGVVVCSFTLKNTTENAKQIQDLDLGFKLSGLNCTWTDESLHKVVSGCHSIGFRFSVNIWLNSFGNLFC